MTTATVTSKGQITIPKEVRDFLGAREGDRLEFSMERDGRVQLRRLGRSIRELAGILHQPGMKPMTQDEMDQAIVDYVTSEDDRIRRGE